MSVFQIEDGPKIRVHPESLILEAVAFVHYRKECDRVRIVFNSSGIPDELLSRLEQYKIDYCCVHSPPYLPKEKTDYEIDLTKIEVDKTAYLSEVYFQFKKEYEH